MEYPHNYMRPPPPPPPPPTGMDPYQRPPGNQPPLPWSGQYHYHPQTQPQSPPPPYAATPPPPPYPANYPTPPPHQLPPRPPPPQPYYHQPQEWGSGSSSHHQSWEYTANSNAEDWAAKARAWAAAKSASESQHQQPHFVQAGQPEVPNHYPDQYPQTNTRFSDDHTRASQAPNHQHYPTVIGASTGASHGQMQHGESSYAANMPIPYAPRDGSSVGNDVTTFPQPEKSSPSQFVHQQEVPSSYSSVPGNEAASNRYEKFNDSSSFPVASIKHHHVHPLPTTGGNQTAESLTDLSNQPLNFAPHFNRDLDPHVQSNYAHSPGSSLRGTDPVISSNYVWGPSSAAATVYPPVPPLMPSLPPVDQQIPLTTPASATPAPAFPTGPGFQPPVSMVGSAFGAGLTPHPTASSANGYGVPGFPERPKKASVPNWLREEIIKNKSIVKNNVPEISQDKYSEDSFSGPYEKKDQADSKSLDSSKSSEDEDVDEDEEEAARTAAINQEIKRILTEVLLKVTDELFDEIATKVLKEDDFSGLAPPTPASVTPKATGKVLIAKKIVQRDNEDSNDKSTSGPPGGLLGLANYASDEEDDEVQSPDLSNQNKNSTAQQPSSSMISEGNPARENGDFREQVNHSITEVHTGSPHKSSPVTNTSQPSLTNKELNSKKDKELAPRDSQCYDGNVDSRRLMGDDPTLKATGNMSPENKMGSHSKGHKDSESSGKKLDKNSNEDLTKHEERHSKSKRMGSPEDDLRGKGKAKVRSGEQSIKDSDSRKRSPPLDDKERTSDSGRERNHGKDDSEERRWSGSRDGKQERSRHKSERESGRHKQRRRSSSVSHENDSNEESSDDSKRKSHRSRRRRSPSPIRQRKRAVSRSPNSKHSKRRHSPYSSLENRRRRRSLSRSRSRSPVHRRR